MRQLDLSPLLDSFSRCHIAVIGDLMLDEYLWGHIDRISPEAPVPILNVVSRSSTLGGAGNVVENLRSLGAEVTARGDPDVVCEIVDQAPLCAAAIRTEVDAMLDAPREER